MTQKELAKKLNVSIAAISRWENQVCYPDITMLPELASILGTNIDSLFSLKENTYRSVREPLQKQVNQSIIYWENINY